MTKDEIKKLKNAFYSQRCSARNRVDRNGNPIEFRLTFEEWLRIWLESGHLNERGRLPHQYVMSRYNDIGHYEIGNVCIKTFSENRREAAKYQGTIKSSGKKCKTPFGVFITLIEAAKAEGVTSAAICWKLKNKKPGYEYV